MDISNLDRKRLMQCWGEYGDLLMKVLKGLDNDYASELATKQTEWENAQQLIEYLAKKKCLVDVSKILTEKL